MQLPAKDISDISREIAEPYGRMPYASDPSIIGPAKE